MPQRSTIRLISRVRGVALGLALTVTVAFSANPATAAESTAQPDYPKVLHQMVDAGKIQVVKQFATDKPGMTGYLVKRGGYQTVVYGEDGYLMLGPLYGPQGKNLSQQYQQQYRAKPDIAGIISGLDKAHLIAQGAADAPTLYVFADPNCIFCHKLYQQVGPLVQAGRLKVRWIMVGVLGPSSTGRADTILAADDPAAALARNEAHFDVKHEQGGVAASALDPKLGKVLKDHRQAMFDAGGTGTPTVLFRDSEGDWQARQGLPPQGWLPHYAGKVNKQ